MTAHPLVIGFLANMAWASLAMLVVLLIRRPVARLFGAGPAYALWLLPALRLIAPPLPAFAPEIAPTLPPLTLIVSVAGEAAPLSPGGGPGQWLPLLLALWAGGAAMFLLWQYLAYRRFVAGLALDGRRLGTHRGLALIESASAQGPLALGLLRRRIIVPIDFESRYSPVERRLALEHEAVHHRRGDIWWNHAGLLILALNWFNPVAWLAFRAFRADQELACDAAVAAAASPEARLDYARALIKSASRPGLIAACPLNHADQLKRRLRMMKDHKSSRLRMFGGAAAIALLAGASLSFGVPSFAQPAAPPEAAPPASRQESGERRERREERVIVMMHHNDRDGENHADGEHRAGAGPHAAGNEDRTVRTIVRTHRHGESGGGHAGHPGHAGHAGMAGHRMAIADCREGNRPIVDENEGDDNRRMRLVLCGPSNMDPARRLAALQRAREHLAGESELSAEARARILATLDREIARARGN